jgi:hypothetical protein
MLGGPVRLPILDTIELASQTLRMIERRETAGKQGSLGSKSETELDVNRQGGLHEKSTHMTLLALDNKAEDKA